MKARLAQRVILRVDHVTGGAAIILGLLVLALSGDLPFGSLSFPGAGMWPKLICILMIALSVLLFLRASASKPIAEISWSDLAHAAIVTVANVGFRFAQRQARVGGKIGRATIGRPSSQRSRSSASAPAD